MEDHPMYAMALDTRDLYAVQEKSTEQTIPYCFILDDSYRVLMAGPSTGMDPLAHLYLADASAETLPGPIDRVVRALTATWRSSRAATAATASVRELHVTVAPMHGGDGRRIAVFIKRND
jgi:hypothetical protein